MSEHIRHRLERGSAANHMSGHRVAEHVSASPGGPNTGAFYGLPGQYGNGRGTDEGAIGRVQSQKDGSSFMSGATMLEVINQSFEVGLKSLALISLT